MFLPKEEIVSGSRDEGQGDNSRRSPRTVKSPSAPSSSSSGRMDDEEAMAQASMMSARAAGDVFIRHVYDQDGVRQTLRGKDADPGLYETMLRLGYVDSDSDGDEDEEEADGDWEWSERKRLRQYKTVSCGFGPDGTVRRMPKEELKYSSAKLKALLESMISPRTNIPQQLITLNK